jgi:hypothetical protein
VCVCSFVCLCLHSTATFASSPSPNVLSLSPGIPISLSPFPLFSPILSPLTLSSLPLTLPDALPKGDSSGTIHRLAVPRYRDTEIVRTPAPEGPLKPSSMLPRFLSMFRTQDPGSLLGVNRFIKSLGTVDLSIPIIESDIAARRAGDDTEVEGHESVTEAVKDDRWTDSQAESEASHGDEKINKILGGLEGDVARGRDNDGDNEGGKMKQSARKTAVSDIAVSRTGEVTHCTVLYCTVLYCTILCCIVLYYTILYCTVLYCTVLYCTVLYCTVLYCTVLY